MNLVFAQGSIHTNTEILENGVACRNVEHQVFRTLLCPSRFCLYGNFLKRKFLFCQAYCAAQSKTTAILVTKLKNGFTTTDEDQ